MAQFAQQTPDENLVQGWTVQGNIITGGVTGYAQAAPVPVTTNVGQAGAGLPNPPLAENIGSENSGAYGASVLNNGSYSVTPNTSTTAAPVTTPVPGLTAAQQPFGVNATAYIVIPSTVTGVYVAPFSTTAPSGTGSPWVLVSAGGVAETVTATVPPAGWIKTTGVAATSVSYVPTN